MPETISLGLLVVNKSILLVKQAYGKHLWTLPGGVVENNETIAQAVVREVIEETGLVTQAKGIVSLRNRTDQTVVVFELEIKSGQLLDSVVGEIEETKWFTHDDLINAGQSVEQFPYFIANHVFEFGTTLIPLQTWQGYSGNADLFIK